MTQINVTINLFGYSSLEEEKCINGSLDQIKPEDRYKRGCSVSAKYEAHKPAVCLFPHHTKHSSTTTSLFYESSYLKEKTSNLCDKKQVY